MPDLLSGAEADAFRSVRAAAREAHFAPCQSDSTLPRLRIEAALQSPNRVHPGQPEYGYDDIPHAKVTKEGGRALALLSFRHSELDGLDELRGKVRRAAPVKFAAVFFLLLFPGFFVYHYLLAVGVLPRVLGGLFGPTTVLAAVAFFPFLVYKSARVRGANLIGLAAFGTLLVYTSSFVVLHYMLSAETAVTRPAAEQAFTMIVAWVALFGVGYYLVPTKWLVRWSAVLFLIMTAIAWLHLDLSRMMFNPRALADNSTEVATYQGFARSYVVTALLLLAVERRLVGQLGIVLLSVPTLFILGARTEFTAFFLVLAFWFAQLYRSYGGLKTAAVALVLVLCASSALVAVPQLVSSRVANLLDLASDSSWRGRQERLAAGWEAILANPIFGDFGGHIRESGPGYYIHNILSAWRQFGLVGFVLFAGLSAGTLVVSMSAVLASRRPKHLELLALYMNAFVFTALLAAKPVFWSLPALAWGLAVRPDLRPNPLGQTRAGTRRSRTEGGLYRMSYR